MHPHRKKEIEINLTPNYIFNWYGFVFEPFPEIILILDFKYNEGLTAYSL